MGRPVPPKTSEEAYFKQGLPTAAWADRSPAEKALLAGIQASGVLDHRLTMRVPRSIHFYLDEVARRSGAVFELGAGEAASADPDHLYVTAVGPRMATSLAALYIQECLSM